MPVRFIRSSITVVIDSITDTVASGRLTRRAGIDQNPVDAAPNSRRGAHADATLDSFVQSTFIDFAIAVVVKTITGIIDADRIRGPAGVDEATINAGFITASRAHTGTTGRLLGANVFIEPPVAVIILTIAC